MAGKYSIIPLTSEPDQRMRVTLPVDGRNLTLGLRVRYNTEGRFWWMTVSDRAGTVLLDSVPLLPGEYPAADILGQYRYLGLGSAALVRVGGQPADTADSPDDTNLGSDYALIWGDTVP